MWYQHFSRNNDELGELGFFSFFGGAGLPLTVCFNLNYKCSATTGKQQAKTLKGKKSRFYDYYML